MGSLSLITQDLQTWRLGLEIHSLDICQGHADTPTVEGKMAPWLQCHHFHMSTFPTLLCMIASHCDAPPPSPAPPAPLLPPPHPSQLPGFSQRLTHGKKNFLHWLPGSMGSFSCGREQRCLPIRPSSDRPLSAAYISAKLLPSPAGLNKQIWARFSVSDQ